MTTSQQHEDPASELARLRAENEALKATKARSISMKIGEKGGMSFYGLGRFPVTLYREQWVTLLDHADKIRTFLTENASKLKAKGE